MMCPEMLAYMRRHHGILTIYTDQDVAPVVDYRETGEVVHCEIGHQNANIASTATETLVYYPVSKEG